MNLRLVSILILLTIAFGAKGQAPLGINYQGVARSADGSPIINKEIALRISVTNGPQGSTDYVEEHFIETNDFGLFSLVIGNGSSSGNLNDVDWLQGNKWLEIELDPNAGNNYMLVGSQQLMSVPYALYSTKSGDDLNPGVGIDITNGQVSNTLPDQIISLNGVDATSVTGTYPNFTIQSTDEVDDADADPANEIQAISKTGSLVTLSNGGGSFTDATADADADPANEIQAISKTGSLVTLSNGGGSFTDATADADADPANEIQAISKTGSLVTLSNGGGSFTDATADADADPTNEIQAISKTGSLVTLSNGGGSFTDATTDADADPSNEIQIISKTGSLVTLSNGGGSFTDAVSDADSNSANELNVSGSYQPNNTIRITDPGGNVDIPVGTLNANLNANSNRLTNIGDPVSAGDAVNLGYLETKDATDYAFKSLITESGTGAAITFNLTGFDFDEGNLIAIDQVQVTESGVYLFNVKGSSTANAPIVINVNSTTDYTVGLINVNRYSDTILLKLTAGDIIELRANSTTAGESFSLEFFGYKI